MLAILPIIFNILDALPDDDKLEKKVIHPKPFQPKAPLSFVVLQTGLRPNDPACRESRDLGIKDKWRGASTCGQ
jgi:hypothetical protein